jgi:AbrB family looped-hinge helix DNA binding protein
MDMTELAGTFRQKIKSQGRIVIPKIVRDGVELNIGDDVTVTVRKTKGA